MPWFRVEDGFAANKKVLRIPRKRRCAAIGLWALVGTWCARELTDGAIPDYVIAEMGGTQRMVDDLIAAELWLPLPPGYLYPNWDEYQPSREETEGKRAAARERMQRVRKGSRAVRAYTSDGSREVRSTPTRPDPTRTNVPAEHSEPPAGDGFDEWWALYPKKVNKQAALAKWKTTAKRVPPKVLLAGLRRYVAHLAAEGTDPQFIKGPEVWLNKGCWSDEYPAPRGLRAITARQQHTDDIFDRAAAWAAEQEASAS